MNSRFSRDKYRRKSPAKRKARQDEERHPPQMPSRSENTPASLYRAGEVRMQKHRDNKPKRQLEHNLMTVNDEDGDPKRFTPFEPEWDEDGNIIFTYTMSDNGKSRKFKITGTEVI